MYGIDGLARKTNNPLNVGFFCAVGVVIEADCVSNPNLEASWENFA